MSVVMTYGGSGLVPVPLISIVKQQQANADGSVVGTVMQVVLDGTVWAGNGGTLAVTSGQHDIRSIFAQQGAYFDLSCDGNEILTGYPRVVVAPSFEQSTNNWVFTSRYSVTLEFDADQLNEDAAFLTVAADTYIQTSQETWNVEFVPNKSFYDIVLNGGIPDSDGYQLAVSHSVSAVGKKHYDSGGLVLPAWQQAQKHVVSKLGFASSVVYASGVLNLNIGNFGQFDHIRTSNADIDGGTYSATETWMLIDTTNAGVAGNATEDFTIDIKSGSQSPLTSVSIQGTIQGLETKDYGSSSGAYAVTTSKFTAASGYWNNIKDGNKVLPRVQTLYSGVRPLNIEPLSRAVGYNFIGGIINYSYEYDNRPSNCIAGALIESINITDINAVDVFAELPILGRTAGPILQDMGTVTSRKKEMSIDVVMQPSTGCTVALLNSTNPQSAVASLIDSFYVDLTGSYSQVFTHTDTETWEPKDGRYTRQVGWTYSNCS